MQERNQWELQRLYCRVESGLSNSAGVMPRGQALYGSAVCLSFSLLAVGGMVEVGLFFSSGDLILLP